MFKKFAKKLLEYNSKQPHHACCDLFWLQNRAHDDDDAHRQVFRGDEV